MQEVRKSTFTGASFLTVRERDNNTLRIVVDDQTEGSQVRIQMDKIDIPNNINFHKQASKALYSDLLKSYLNKSMLEKQGNQAWRRDQEGKSCIKRMESPS